MDPLALAQAGPVALLIAGMGLLYRAFQRGDVVAGHMYRQERADRIKAEKALERLLRKVQAVPEPADDAGSGV